MPSLLKYERQHRTFSGPLYLGTNALAELYAHDAPVANRSGKNPGAPVPRAEEPRLRPDSASKTKKIAKNE